MKKITVLSLFDGISTGYYSLKEAGFEIGTYYSSEVDVQTTQISMYHYPDIIQLGDVSKWKEWSIDWSKIDLLIGGSPCQGFSYSGKGLNFNDPRSALFF